MEDQMTHAEAASKLAELAEENERLRTGLIRMVALYEGDHDEIPRRPAWLVELLATTAT